VGLIPAHPALPRGVHWWVARRPLLLQLLQQAGAVQLRHAPARAVRLRCTWLPGPCVCPARRLCCAAAVSGLRPPSCSCCPLHTNERSRSCVHPPACPARLPPHPSRALRIPLGRQGPLLGALRCAAPRCAALRHAVPRCTLCASQRRIFPASAAGSAFVSGASPPCGRQPAPAPALPRSTALLCSHTSLPPTYTQHAHSSPRTHTLYLLVYYRSWWMSKAPSGKTTLTVCARRWGALWASISSTTGAPCRKLAPCICAAVLLFTGPAGADTLLAARPASVGVFILVSHCGLKLFLCFRSPELSRVQRRRHRGPCCRRRPQGRAAGRRRRPRRARRPWRRPG
jgi:hypothetical protein